MGMFYKRRDYTQIVNGRNPIVAHEFLGSSVEGKDVIIVDDMISSGESMQDVAKELKRRKARKVFICSTFGLFTNGLAKFDEYYENGTIDRILTTNLVYQTPDLLSRPYYINVDMSKYIALIIDNPVSYTHLDVYKRQRLHCGSPSGQSGICSGHGKRAADAEPCGTTGADDEKL